MEVIVDQQDVDVFIGLDVGKSGHHAVALNRAGRKLFDKALPNDEAKLREILAGLTGHGKILLVVDQPATIGALPVAVAQAAGATVGYIPGLAMRRIADLHPGQAKTDARDAMIIADAARTMPHTLRSIALNDQTLAELGVLCGFDDDLAGQITAVSNRIRGLLTQIHPALERPLGPQLDHPAVADLLTRYPTPAALRTAGTSGPGWRNTPRGPPSASPRPSSPRSGNRAWWWWAPARPGSCSRNWPNSSCPCGASATRSPPRSRPWWRPTLFTGS